MSGDLYGTRIDYSVSCDACGLIGAGLNEDQARALRNRHYSSCPDLREMNDRAAS